MNDFETHPIGTAKRIEELEATLSVGSEECQRFADQVDYLGAENERLEAEVERLRDALQRVADDDLMYLSPAEWAREELAAAQETDNDT